MPPNLLPDAAPQGLADATTSNPTSPNTFGAGVAAEVQDQGQKVVDMVNSNLASDMLTTGVQRLAKRWGEFSQLEGQNAFNAVDGYQKDVKQIMTGVVNASPNLKVRSLVAQSLAYQADRYMLYGQDHANGALKQWNIKSAQDGAANNYSQMGIALQNGDREGALTNMHAGDDQLLHLNSTIHGLPTDAATMETAKARDAYITNTLRDISNSNPPRAVALFDDPEIGGKLTANARAILMPQIRDAKADIVVDASQQDMTGPDAFVDGIPNKQAWMDAALKRGKELDPGDPDLLHRIQQKVTQRYQGYAADYAGNKQVFVKTLTDTREALQNGVDAPIDEKAIKFYYPGEAGDRVVQELNIAKVGGQVASDLRFASPQEVNDDLTQLTTGMGRKADDLWIQYKHATGPGAAPGSTPAPADADFYKLRAAAVTAAHSALSARNDALQKDPAAYVGTEPGVQAASQALQQDLASGHDPSQTGTLDKYFSAAGGVYEHMGVPPEDRHYLTRTAAESFANDITNSADPTSKYASYAKEFGAHWSDVYHDMVTLGKISPAYQALAVDGQGQSLLKPTDAAVLQTTLHAIKDMKPADIENTYRKNEVDTAFRKDNLARDYVNAAVASGSSPEQQEGIQLAIQTLAFGYVKNQGIEPATAVTMAVSAFTHDLTKFSKAYVPTNNFQLTMDNTNKRLHAITADNIITPLDRGSAGSYAAAVVSNPEWIGSPDAKGLILTFNGGLVRWLDGTPVTAPFNEPVANMDARTLYQQTRNPQHLATQKLGNPTGGWPGLQGAPVVSQPPAKKEEPVVAPPSSAYPTQVPRSLLNQPVMRSQRPVAH